MNQLMDMDENGFFTKTKIVERGGKTGKIRKQ